VPPLVTRPRPDPPRRRQRLERPPASAVDRQAQALADQTVPEQRGAGTIRRLWRTAFGSIPGPVPFAWAQNPPLYGRRTLRYRATYMGRGAGTSATITGAPRRIVLARARVSPITRQAGNAPSRPTVRNRLRSFGSRVPTINQPSPNVDATES